MQDKNDGCGAIIVVTFGVRNTLGWVERSWPLLEDQETMAEK